MIFIYESIISFALFFVSFLSLSSSPAVSWSPSINFILAAQRSPPSAFGEKTELYNIYPRKQSIKLMSGTGDGMVSVSTTAKTVDADEKKVKVLGVGGGIGSGKSTACKLLVSEMSCLGHVDADSVAHTVYSPGSQAIRDIAQEFGSDILIEETGEIDRKKLGAIVFAERSAMERLEQIVWPHTKDEVIRRIEDIVNKYESKGNEEEEKATVPVVVVEAAVLLDADWHKDFLDGVLMVTAKRDVALQRLIETRGWTKEEAEQRLDAQVSRRGIGNLDDEVANKNISAVVDNSGSLDDLKSTLEKALNNPSLWY